MTISIGIIGAGISGLTTAFYIRQHLEKNGTGARISLYDSKPRSGGSIHSRRINGFLVEWGPNGFLNNEPATLRLVDDLDIRDRLLVSRDSARRRFLLINGKLMEVPTKPRGFIKTGILPFTAKMRFALEPFMPSSKDEDESVAAFVRRRFGKAAVKRMFDPLMSGIYAGDVEKLSVKSTFKVFSEMEEQYGSVVRGMFKKIKERKAAEKQDEQEGTADPLLTRSKNPMTGKLLSFQEGMGQLTERLQTVLSENTIHSAHISKIDKTEAGYAIHGRREGAKLSAEHDYLIVATPPPEAGPMLENLDGELAKTLSAIRSSTIAVVALGFKAADIENPLDGFGYLIPRSEGKRSLGVLWSSSIFENRNPEGTKLLTVMIGGAHDPEAITLSDEALISTAISESEPQLGFRGDPQMTRIIRHSSGIPQYNVGHGQRLRTIESCLKSHPALYLAGNGYYGISANDCIRHARELAGRVAETIRR